MSATAYGFGEAKGGDFMQNVIYETKQIKKKGNTYGKFEITPLDQGYGHTLGNSLRRVLLGGLSGAAITSVRIAGVKHHFSTLKGMKEDVIELVLNLKKVRFEYESKEPTKIKLSKSGPGEIKAKDLEVPATLRVANPELVLAILNKGHKLSADIEVEVGVGYSPSEERTGKGPVGLIPMDASFSPVIRVDYKVEETRVGGVTNYDKLIMEITTDGTIKPKEALVEAAKILVGFFNQIVSPKKMKKVKEDVEADTLGPVGQLSVEEIGLPTRVANALVKAGIDSVEDLVNADKEDLMKVRNLGEKSLKIISVALAEKEVKFEV